MHSDFNKHKIHSCFLSKSQGQCKLWCQSDVAPSKLLIFMYMTVTRVLRVDRTLPCNSLKSKGKHHILFQVLHFVYICNFCCLIHFLQCKIFSAKRQVNYTFYTPIIYCSSSTENIHLLHIKIHQFVPFFGKCNNATVISMKQLIQGQTRDPNRDICYKDLNALTFRHIITHRIY